MPNYTQRKQEELQSPRSTQSPQGAAPVQLNSLRGLSYAEQTAQLKPANSVSQTVQQKGPGGDKATPVSSEKGGGNDYGLKNYRSTLGHTLGPVLYDSVSGALEYDRVASYADSAFKLGLNTAGDYIKALDSKDNVSIDPRAVDVLVNATLFHFSAGSRQFFRTNGSGMVDSMQGLVDENPEVVAGVAVVAAGAAIAANMSIPELKYRLKLSDEMTLRLGADLGRFQDISLQRMSAELNYQKGQLSMSLGAQHDRRGNIPETSVGFRLGYKF